MYYYFVAEHLASELIKRTSKESTSAQLKEMAKFVAYEEYAQILMFVIYKTKDPDLIEELIENATRIFEGLECAELDGDIAFVNRLEIRRHAMALPSKSVTESRDERRRQMSEGEPELSHPQQKVEYSSELDLAAKVQYAFKIIQMLGRVLRNFPGRSRLLSRRSSPSAPVASRFVCCATYSRKQNESCRSGERN